MEGNEAQSVDSLAIRVYVWAKSHEYWLWCGAFAVAATIVLGVLVYEESHHSTIDAKHSQLLRSVALSPIGTYIHRYMHTYIQSFKIVQAPISVHDKITVSATCLSTEFNVNE